MTRLVVLLLVPLALACQTETEPPVPVPVKIELAGAAAGAPAMRSSAILDTPRAKVVTIPNTGDLSAHLAGEAQKAAKLGLTPYVEFTADWCLPCRKFKEYIHDPQMVAALEGAYIILASYDHYGDAATAMKVIGIPTWLELDEKGQTTGRRITSSVWGEDIPKNMAPPLAAFFRKSR